MGMTSPEILKLVENCPKGAETLVTRIIHILTEHGKFPVTSPPCLRWVPFCSSTITRTGGESARLVSQARIGRAIPDSGTDGPRQGTCHCSPVFLHAQMRCAILERDHQRLAEAHQIVTAGGQGGLQSALGSQW